MTQLAQMYVAQTPQAPMPALFAAPTAPRVHRFRKVFSREQATHIRILVELPPGRIQQGCLVCIPSPSCMPCCQVIPCCGMPQYIKDELEDSKWIYLTEQGLMLNEPHMASKECCGGCMMHPCFYRAQDNISMVAYDDPALNGIKNATGCCMAQKQRCCGGNGAPLLINQTYCAGCCLPVDAIPGCCLPVVCGCMPCRSACQVPGLIMLVDVESGKDCKDKITKVRDAIRQRIK